MSDFAKTQYSILDLATFKADGDICTSFEQSLDLAQHAEKWGYTRFWLAEHHNMPGIGSAATSVLIGYIAGGTSSIRVGAGGIMLPNHPPLVIAEQFGTLETLYPGRIDLGLGRAPGSDRLTAHALRRGVNTEESFPRQVQELLDFFAPVTPGQKLQAVPGGGTNVPVWLLGSSTFSAQLAAVMGLPFGFASHFAPELLYTAIRLYREYFRPSQYLQKPYVMVGLPVIAADTDREAERLATSPAQRFLNLLRGKELYTVPPVETMEGLWNPDEKTLVESKLGVSIVGSLETITQKLKDFQQRTGADEFIMTSDLYHHVDRLHSYELAAAAMQSLNNVREESGLQHPV